MGTYDARVRHAWGSIASFATTAVQSNGKLTAVGIGPALGSYNDGTVPWNTTLIASWSGGTPPFVVAWDFGDGTENGSGNPVTHEYTTVGNFTVQALVSDAVGESALSNDERIESAAPLAVQLAVSPNTTEVGSAVTLQAHVSGGFPPYSYLWSDLPSSCPAANMPSLSCSAQAPGTYVVSVHITDHFEDKTTSSSTLVVRSQGSATASSVLVWIGIGAAGVAVVIAAVWAVRRSKRKQSRPPEGPPPRSQEPPPSA